MLGLFALLIVGQGALRKWLLPGLSTPLYVAKDVALLAALVLFGVKQRLHLAAPLRGTLLPVLWAGFAFVVVLQSFNLNTPSLAVSAVGIKSYLLYTSLLVLLPAALQRVARPERLVLVVAGGIVVPVLMLGIYQYNQPVGAWINQYVSDEMQAVGVLSRPRITGPFSYIGGMGAFLSFALFLSLGIFLAGLRHKHRLYRWLGGGLLVLSLVVAPMNGSRSVVLGFLVPLPFVFYVLLRGQKALTIAVSMAVLVFAGGYVASRSQWMMQGWEILGHRMEHSSDRNTRIQSMLMDPFHKVDVGGVLGYGTGATHQSATALSSQGRLQIEGVYYEGELGRVLIELGVIGALFFFALKAWLAWTAWQALRRARSAWETLLSATAFCKLFLNFGIGMIVFNHISGALYWLCAGAAVWVWCRQERGLGRQQQLTIGR